MAHTNLTRRRPQPPPVGADLDAWARYDWTDGIQVDRLEPLETLIVETGNSTYSITVVTPATGDIIIQGGRFFPIASRAHLAGSSLGGSFLKLRGIYVGFRVEILHDDRTIVTTPVQVIRSSDAGQVQ